MGNIIIEQLLTILVSVKLLQTISFFNKVMNNLKRQVKLAIIFAFLS